jgi:cytochrome c oxidase cbb3-type subunit 3
MSSGWSWFVIIGTIGSLLAALWLLFANRKISGEETTGHEHDGIQELDNPLPMWWVYMFVITVVFAFGYLVYYPGLGNIKGVGDWTSIGQWQQQVDRHEERFAPLFARLAAMSPAEMAADRSAMQVGRRLFLNNCATCHGTAAQGGIGFPNLTDSEWLYGRSYPTILQTILNGRMAVMPPWGAALGDEGVQNVTQYVLKLAGRDHDEAAAAKGKAQYDIMCVACHGADGHGNQTLGYPNLTNDVWLYGGDPAQIAFTIRNGRNGNMPAHRDILGEDKAKVLAGYVLTLSEPGD